MASYSEHIKTVREATEEYEATIRDAWERYQGRISVAMDKFLYGEDSTNEVAAPREMATEARRG